MAIPKGSQSGRCDADALITPGAAHQPVRHQKSWFCPCEISPSYGQSSLIIPLLGSGPRPRQPAEAFS